MALLKFVFGFALGFAFIGAIVGIGLWLLTLIISAISFSWLFVLIIAGVAGLLFGVGIALAD